MSAITAETPMMMPNMVKVVRSLLAPSARSATLTELTTPLGFRR